MWEVSLHLSPQKLNESFRRENSEETDITKQIALQRIHTLFRLAKENVHENPELAQRYTEIARKIAMKTNLRLPREYKQLICRHCKSFIPPGVNCRVRIQSRRDPHVVVTCLKCGKHMRIPLERKRKNVNAQDEAPNKT